ncbi:hypothetical protein L198_07402 [Cryptococcus wingfieldii CBS 7118]|uniref:Zn(2)-C6 fungal-type domain-containing protein n=1 Tax=Cryptococcus wingfieldii CBS 7118 TaxID=1295528 RepID=A0A1E3IBY9_9TREE|nr:hypothetical protein L198_07402 [Cryptococcus wingfieldii CBS 7118]ODN86109.1 hypothetical protein L198_07402 [Cryptococcus wingfieldii CBS 7118]
MSSDSQCFSGISPMVPYPFPFSLPTYRDTSTEDLSAQAVAAPSYEEEAEEGLFLDGVKVSQEAFFNYYLDIQSAPEAGATVETAGSPTCDFAIATVSAPATPQITSTTTPTKNVSTCPAPSTYPLSAQTVVAPSHEEEADAELFNNGVKVSQEEFFNYQFGIQPAPEKAGTIDVTAGPLTREPSIVPISPPTTPKLASTAISKTPVTPTQKSAGKKRSPNPSNKSPAKAPTPAHLKRAGIKRTKKHNRSTMACECCRIARRSCNVDDIYRCDRCTIRGYKCCFWLEGRGALKVRPRTIELGLEIFTEDGKQMVIAPERSQIGVQAGPSQPASAASLEQSSSDRSSPGMTPSFTPSTSIPNLSYSMSAPSSQASINLATPSSAMFNITGPAPAFESQPAAAPSFNYGFNGLANLVTPSSVMFNISGPAPAFESQPAAAPSFNYGFNGLAAMPEFQAQPAEADIDWSFGSYVASAPATASNVHVSLPAPTTFRPAPATFGPTLGLEMDVAGKGPWNFPADSPAAPLFTGPAMTNSFSGLEGMMDVGSSCEVGGQPFYWDELEAMA